MPVTVAIRFLAGRAHLHPWETHHSEGKVEWPPSPWRLLRALVAVAGRGLTSLPGWDEIPPPRPYPVVPLPTVAFILKRGVPKQGQGKLSFSRAKRALTLKETLTDDEADAWKRANASPEFAAALDELRRVAALPNPTAMANVAEDVIPLSRLAALVESLAPAPEIWLPKTNGGHTRQFFPIHEAGVTKPSGSAVFDTFAVVTKSEPLVFHWPLVDLSPGDATDLRGADLMGILSRLMYFGRGESWCEAVYSKTIPEGVELGKTHWYCICLEDAKLGLARAPEGQEHRDYTLERCLAALPLTSNEGSASLKVQAVALLPELPLRPRRNQAARDSFRSVLVAEDVARLLLRCLLRGSGQDLADGLERPVGTRWVHYAVPRAVYDIPPPRPASHSRRSEMVQVVRYTLNTATTHRPVLPALTDTLLVADRFRAAVIAIYKKVVHPNGHPRNLCGREEYGDLCRDHTHAFFWPTDENNDGFIEHVTVYCPGGFEQGEIDALRRLLRIRQRGGRPDLLVTPVFLGRAAEFGPWQGPASRTFVSATPYFCPVYLSHGKSSGGLARPIKPEIKKGMRDQKLITDDDEVDVIDELVFDYAPREFADLRRKLDALQLREPVPPRQYFPVVDPPAEFPPLPALNGQADPRYRNALLKDPDVKVGATWLGTGISGGSKLDSRSRGTGYPFGLSIGLLVDDGTRFVRALSFCRRRRDAELKGHGRMFRITFREPKASRPFAIGAQCHFGLGLFTPQVEAPRKAMHT